MSSSKAAQAVNAMKRVMSFLNEKNTFDKVMQKVQITSGDVGHCICELKVEEEHTNRVGFLHGGLTATLVDSVSTVALMSTEQGNPGVSVDMNITYMKAVPLGQEIIIDAKTLKVGRSTAFLTVDIKNKSDGSLVAQGRHTKHLLGK
ncbi:acyl-coenzyme A thioesterase 13-like [Tubulanus polymorphus]|uniref:acyl-coenzyme A thioesterase 13-like n=1 Tax=Tubulanus polymorphus TaxID=672921 RepID=UPI003DA2B4ED